MDIFIIGADCIIDGNGDLSKTRQIREKLASKNLNAVEYSISSIWDGWNTPLASHRLRCACSPMTAILEAKRLFSQQEADAVITYGKDHIRSDFRDQKAKRDQFMHIYGDDGHIMTAYNKLSHAFLKRWNITPDQFQSLAAKVFENHLRVWQQKHPHAKRPDEKWFAMVTDLLRGVDCANPSVDFEGCLVLAPKRSIEKCGLNPADYLQVMGCHIEQVGEDSMATIPQIAPYEHLNRAYLQACQQAQVDFRTEFLAERALLEVYTCYPVVPLGFLLATGMVASVQEIPAWLEKYPLTITGGLNLAKAPWNNTTLYAVIEMLTKFKEKESPALGGIHSVGSIGYQQAFAILKK